MGKDLRGKELGVGISQRKDGLYTGRYTDSYGNRRQKYFKKLQDCKKWIADSQFEKEHGTINAMGDMTVATWFEFWLTELKAKNLKPSTVIPYRANFKIIDAAIGSMFLKDVKSMHCQKLLNDMDSQYAGSRIRTTKVLLHSIFGAAVDNDMIAKNPVTKKVVCPQGKPSKEERVLSVKEQKSFLIAAANSAYFNQYAFLLQTGLRIGELAGLKWSDIDFKEKIMYIQRTAYYHSSLNGWKIGPPKSKSGIRTIPLTQEAVDVLMKQKEKLKREKIISINYPGLVFLSGKGKPIADQVYVKDLQKVCQKANIKTISPHTLRHSFATRCIEAGMLPKILQKILGHSSVSFTMDLYVHATEEQKIKEIKNIETALKIV